MGWRRRAPTVDSHYPCKYQPWPFVVTSPRYAAVPCPTSAPRSSTSSGQTLTLYRKHLEGLERFRDRKGIEPMPLDDTLPGVAQEIERAFERQAKSQAAELLAADEGDEDEDEHADDASDDDLSDDASSVSTSRAK